MSRAGLQRLHPNVLLPGGGSVMPVGMITSGGRRQTARGEPTIADRLHTPWEQRARDIIMRCVVALAFVLPAFLQMCWTACCRHFVRSGRLPVDAGTAASTYLTAQVPLTSFVDGAGSFRPSLRRLATSRIGRCAGHNALSSVHQRVLQRASEPGD